MPENEEEGGDAEEAALSASTVTFVHPAPHKRLFLFARLAADVTHFVAPRVAHYKRIRHVEFVESIPKSPSGKILRRVLVERERASRQSASA